MLAWLVGEVDGAAGDAAACGVEAGVGVGGLEHVPIGKNVQVRSQKRVVGVDEDVPWVRGWYTGEKVVTITHHHAWLVLGELRVEEDLRDLGHAGYGFYAEVAERVDGPGVLEGGDVAGTIGRICQ